MAAYNIDVFGGCESNVNWPLLPDHACLSQWFHDANQCQSYAANSIHEKFGPYQFSGTFWICAGHATHHLSHAERDPTGLGCWVVCTIQSRSGHHIRLIFGYRPCSNSASRLHSVLAQHQRFFNQSQREGCPCHLFLSNLGDVIQSWQTARDAMILFADMNDDIRRPILMEFIEWCNLHELILSCQPGIPAPAMFQQGSRFGRCPIDGAWATPNVIISQSLYCTVANSPGRGH